MLEVLAVIAICRTNSRNAGMRGRNTAWAKAYTVLLWIFCEIIGAIFAGIISVVYDFDLGYGVYALALLGAGLGGLTSWLIAKRGEPIASAYGNLTVNETAYVQNSYALPFPCEVAVIREKSFVGMAAKIEVSLNGQPVGRVGNSEVITFPTYSAQNIITGTDAFGMRFNTCVPFEAPSGGRVEVFMKGGKFLPLRTIAYPGAIPPPYAPIPDASQQPYQTNCPHCGAWGFAPAPNCPSCGARLEG